MLKHVLFTQKMKKYQGKYIVVVGGKVIVTGSDAKAAFASAKARLGRRKIEGIYYVPRKKDLLTALCDFRISS